MLSLWKLLTEQICYLDTVAGILFDFHLYFSTYECLFQYPLANVSVYITHWSGVLQAVFLYNTMLHILVYSITENEACELGELGVCYPPKFFLEAAIVTLSSQGHLCDLKLLLILL